MAQKVSETAESLSQAVPIILKDNKDFDIARALCYLLPEEVIADSGKPQRFFRNSLKNVSLLQNLKETFIFQSFTGNYFFLILQKLKFAASGIS